MQWQFYWPVAVAGVLMIGFIIVYFALLWRQMYWLRYPGIPYHLWRIFANAYLDPEQRAIAHKLIDTKQITFGMRVAFTHWVIDLYNADCQRTRATRPIPKRTRPGFVYLLYCATTGMHKIGRSRNVERRCQQIATQGGYDMEILWKQHSEDMNIAEMDLHGRFVSKRVKGEWFKLDDEDVAWIRAIEVV